MSISQNIWRFFKFQESFKSKRLLNPQAIDRILLNVEQYCKKQFPKEKQQDPIFLEKLIPGIKNGTIINQHVLGILFVKFPITLDRLVLEAFAAYRIRITGKIRESEVLQMYESIQDSSKQIEDEIKEGECVLIQGSEFSGLMGTVVEAIGDNYYKINIQIFGQDQLITLNKQDFTKCAENT